MVSALQAQTAQPPLPFGIASHEQIDFVRLPKKEQRRICDLLAIFNTIDSSEKKIAACKSCAATRRGQRGFSWRSLLRQYNDYIERAYDWNVLVHNYKGQHKGKPEEFKKFIGKLVSECRGRTDISGGVYDRLLNEYWFNGKPVPGYGTFKDFWDNNHPEKPYPRKLEDRGIFKPIGWSPRRIAALVAEVSPRDSVTRNMSAYGWHETHEFFEQLLRDKSNLKPFQILTADDVELDMQAIFPIGNKLQICTVQAVVMMDVATGMIAGYGVRPIYKDDEGRNRVLTRKEVNAVLLNTIMRHGLPVNYPVRLLLENASATLLKSDRDMLDTMLPGRFVIEHTRMARRLLTEHGFIESSGMPYQKGWLESSFKPLHIRLSHLPGTTGARYDMRHGSHEETIKFALQTIENADKTGIDPMRLKFPVLTIDELMPILDRIIAAFNSRTRHRIQGSRYIYEYMRADGTFGRREELVGSENLDGLEITRRLESPLERYTALRVENEFTKVEMPVLYPLMQEKRVVTIRNNQLVISDTAFSNDRLYYRSNQLAALHGQEVIAAFTPDRETAWLFRKDEGFLCAVPRLGRTDITNQTEILKRSGEVHRSRLEAVNPVREFLADRDNYYKEIRVHNDQIFAENADIGNAMIEAQRKAARPTKAIIAAEASRDMGDFMEENPAPGEDDFEYSLEDFTE